MPEPSSVVDELMALGYTFEELDRIMRTMHVDDVRAMLDGLHAALGRCD